MENHPWVVAIMLGLWTVCFSWAGEPPTLQTNTTGIKNIQLEPAAWTYTPQPNAIQLTNEKILLPPRGRGHDHVDAVTVALPFVVQQYSTIMHGQDASSTQWTMEKIDLRDGTVTNQIQLPDDLTVLAITADGTRTALGNKSVHSSHNGEIWLADIKGTTVEPLCCFIPYASEDRNGRTLTHAEFIDRDHLLTYNDRYSQVTLWQVSSSEVKGVWTLKQPQYFSEGSAVTPDHKYVVALNAKGTFFIDALSGKIAGFIEEPVSDKWNAFEYAQLRCAVQPDGRFLARSTNAHAEIYSLEKEPKLMADIFAPTNVKINEIVWINDDYILINRKYLADINKGIIVWTYSGLGDVHPDRAAVFPADGRIWAFLQDRSVGSYAIPDENVKKQLVSLDLNEIMAVRPGMKVTLQIDIPSTKIVGAIKPHFEAELTKNKMILAADQPIKLRVKIGDFHAEHVVYRNVNGPQYGQPDVGTVQNRTLSVAYEVDGRILWEYHIYSGAPLLLSVRPGENVNTAISRSQLGDWKALEYTHIPEYVAAFRDPPGFGETALDLVKAQQENKHQSQTTRPRRHSRNAE